MSLIFDQENKKKIVKSLLDEQEDNFLNEQWSPIVGYEGLYAISSLGRVRRLVSGTNSYAGKVLKTMVNKKTGYPYCKISKNGEVKKAKLHLLVAQAFLGDLPNPSDIVNHKDGNKLNSNKDNLEYITRSENTKHAIAMGLQRVCYNEDNGNTKLSNDQVAEIKALYASGLWLQKQLAEKYKVSRTYINYILKNKYRIIE